MQTYLGQRVVDQTTGICTDHILDHVVVGFVVWEHRFDLSDGHLVALRADQQEGILHRGQVHVAEHPTNTFDESACGGQGQHTFSCAKLVTFAHFVAPL
ncbi:hypothetical protein D9M71_813100 [compost metagenome]